jgi:phosphatidylinositol alpha-1,6-mannosyltransferase
MATTMGIVANKNGWDLRGMAVNVEKIMTKEPPRRVARLETRLTLPADRAALLDAAARAELEKTAHTCPVRLSLAPEVEVPSRSSGARRRPEQGRITMATVLLVSKPVEPPWNDSSKNLVRDLVLGMQRHDALAFGREGGDRELGRAHLEPLHPAAGGGHFAPGLSEQLRVLRRLSFGRRADLWHFFFAPNPKTSSVARVTSRLRNVRSVQTVCSVPRDDVDPKRVLFADRVVVLSHFTAERFARAGLGSDRIVRIPPAAPPLVPLDPERRRKTRLSLGLDPDAPVVLYPGDLEFGSGARFTVEAHAKLSERDAARDGVPRENRESSRRRRRAPSTHDAARNERARDVPRRDGEDPRRVGAADVVSLPSDVAYAKMDYPLVLLEAMALARPVVVASGTPAAELAEGGAARAVAPDVDAVAEALGALVSDAAYREELGARARETVLADTTAHRMARAYEALTIRSRAIDEKNARFMAMVVKPGPS